VCLNRQSVVHRAILENRQFTLNYLTESQQDDADRLAGRLGAQGDGKFTGERWTIGPCDLPCLKNALAVLVCDLSNVTEFGSHSILCGTIREAMVQEHAKPLLYGQGRYMTAAN
jgi:flavin reductase